MDPVIRLEKNEVVQCEGWLMKRRAGYDEEMETEVTSSAQETTGSSLDSFSVVQAQLPASATKMEAMLLRRTERKRYFVLTTRPGDHENAPRALLFYCSRKPIFVQQGKKDDDGSATDLSRLAKAAWQSELNMQLIRGRIVLTDAAEVSLLDSGEVKILVPGKSLFVRPNERNASENKVTGGMWYSALRSAVKDIWQWQNRQEGAGAGSRSGAYSHRSDGATGVDPCPETLDAVLASPLHRRHFQQFCEFSHGAENLIFFDLVSEYEAKCDAVLSAKARGTGTSKGKGSGDGDGNGKAGKLTRQNTQPSLVARLRRMSGKRPMVPKDIRLLGREIIDRFVREAAAEQVNLSYATRLGIMEAFDEFGDKALTPDIFSKAQQEIFELLDVNYFLRFYREEMRKTGAFSLLYGNHGLKGYEAVIAHFGLVKTDLSRLLASYTLRKDQVEAQLGVLRQSLHVSHDVAVPAMATSGNALMQLYRAGAVQIQGLTEFSMQLNDHVLFPLTWLSKAIQIQLEQVIDADSLTIDTKRQAATDLDAMHRREQDLDVLSQMHMMDQLTTSEGEQLLKKHAVAPGEIEKELATAKSAVPALELSLARASKLQDDSVIDSLDKLESLEIYRLEAQQKAARHAAEAEKHLFATLNADSLASLNVFDKFDVGKDIASFISTFTERLSSKRRGD